VGRLAISASGRRHGGRPSRRDWRSRRSRHRAAPWGSSKEAVSTVLSCTRPGRATAGRRDDVMKVVAPGGTKISRQLRRPVRSRVVPDRAMRQPLRLSVVTQGDHERRESLPPKPALGRGRRPQVVTARSTAPGTRHAQSSRSERTAPPPPQPGRPPSLPGGLLTPSRLSGPAARARLDPGVGVFAATTSQAVAVPATEEASTTSRPTAAVGPELAAGRTGNGPTGTGAPSPGRLAPNRPPHPGVFQFVHRDGLHIGE